MGRKRFSVRWWRYSLGEIMGWLNELTKVIVGKPPAAPAAPPVARRPASTTTSAAQQTLQRFPSEVLAAELQRRGWVVMEP